MEKVNHTLEVGKDFKEVVDFLRGLLDDIRAKKEVAAIAAENLPLLMAAVDGYDNLDDAVKGENLDDSAAYLVQQLLQALKPASPAE